MVTRNIILTENQAALSDLEDAEVPNLHSRLTTGLEQARRGELAEGSGEEAIRRAFTVARAQT
jgi:antitoxin ParD1/3/4